MELGVITLPVTLTLTLTLTFNRKLRFSDLWGDQHVTYLTMVSEELPETQMAPAYGAKLLETTAMLRSRGVRG